jgi:hypothetical protein
MDIALMQIQGEWQSTAQRSGCERSNMPKNAGDNQQAISDARPVRAVPISAG